MLKQPWTWLMIGLGWLSLAVGIIGIFLPLLPTTVFVLLAAFFFSKGSVRLHHWLREHPRFGACVRNWEDQQVIPPIGKYASTLLMVPSVGYVVLTRDLPLVLSGAMMATVVVVLWYIWSRPSRPVLRAPKSETLEAKRAVYHEEHEEHEEHEVKYKIEKRSRIFDSPDG